MQVTIQLIDFSPNGDASLQHLNSLLREFFSTFQKKKVRKALLRIDALKLLDYDCSLGLLLKTCEDDEELQCSLVDDREVMMKAVGIDAKVWTWAHPNIQNDHQFRMRAVRQNGMILLDFPESYLTRELVLEAVKQDGEAIQVIFNCDEEIFKEAVKSNGMCLQHIENSDISDELIEIATKEDPYATDDLGIHIHDQSVVNNVALHCGLGNLSYDSIDGNVRIEVMKHHPESINYVNHGDDDFINLAKVALKYCGDLGNLSVELADFTIQDLEDMAKYDGDVLCMVDEYDQTREMILNAAQNNGSSLQYANREFCDDHIIMMEAIKNDPSAIQFSNELFHCRFFILDCVKENGQVFEYVCEEYANDREIVLAAVSNYGLALGYVSEGLQEDEEVVMTAISNCGLALEYADDRYRTREDVVLKAVSQNGLALEFALVQNEEIVKTAIKQCAFTLEFIDEKFQRNKEIVLIAVKECPSIYPQCKMCDDRDVTLCAVEGYGGNLSFASEELRKDKEVVMTAVKSCGLSLAYADERLRDDYDIVKAAIFNNPFSLRHASIRLRLDWGLVRLAKELQDKDNVLWEDIHKRDRTYISTSDEEEDDFTEPSSKIRKVDEEE